MKLCARCKHPFFVTPPMQNPLIRKSHPHKHRRKHPINTRLFKDLWRKTPFFVAGAWVLALLKGNRKSFFLFKE